MGFGSAGLGRIAGTGGCQRAWPHPAESRASQNQDADAKELPGGQGAYGRGSGSGGLVVPHALHPVDQPRQYTPHFGKPYGYGGAFGRGGTPDWEEELFDMIHMMKVISRMLKAGGVVRRQGKG